MPGAVMLSATSALRAGAGKVQIGTCTSAALPIASAIPESLVFPLSETRDGGISSASSTEIVERAGEADVLLVGPGMVDEDAIARLVRQLLNRLDTTSLVLDAGALAPLATIGAALGKRSNTAILTPHAGEMATILEIDKEVIEADPVKFALEGARRLRSVVALKGPETFIASPDGEVYRNTAGNVGLATAGSGDVLAGAIAGLVSRGASPLQAAVWGVHLHGLAGDRLSRRIGPLGYLAREIPAEIPALMAELAGKRKR